MKIKLLSILAFSAMCSSANEPVLLNKGLEMSSAEISEAKISALRGSGADALRLYAYYEIVSVNESESIHWATISAENGFPQGMYVLGFKLSKNAQDKESKVRALYWLMEAKIRGVDLAGGVIKSLQDKEPKS